MELLRINELRTWCDTAEGWLAGQPCSPGASPAPEASSGSRGCTTLLAHYVRDKENPSSQEPPSISPVLFQGLDIDLIKMPLFPDGIDSTSQNAGILGGGSSEGGGSWGCQHCLWRGHPWGQERGALLGAALAGVATSASSGALPALLQLMQLKETALNQLLSPHDTCAGGAVTRRTLAWHAAIVHPSCSRGTNDSQRTGMAIVSLLGMGPERVMWVSPAMEHPHTAQGHPVN